jgi:hypothetical protein
MADGASWYVLVEEECSGGDEFQLSRVEHVEGGVERARERALELAKVHEPMYWPKGQRSVFRVGEDSYMAVVDPADGRWRKPRFRVSVGELVHTEEYVEEVPDTEEEKERRGIFRRKG